jgi:hypothetical protein
VILRDIALVGPYIVSNVVAVVPTLLVTSRSTPFASSLRIHEMFSPTKLLIIFPFPLNILVGSQADGLGEFHREPRGENVELFLVLDEWR